MEPHPEYDEAFKAMQQEDSQARAVTASLDNTASITEVNHAIAQVSLARAQLRRRFVAAIGVGTGLAVGWSVFAWVHFA